MDLNLEPPRAATVPSRRSFLSRALTRRVPDGADGPKGPLGLTTVFEPRPGTAVIADLVFVHGLNGGSRSTWSKGNQPTHFWPQEWLPRYDAFQDVRIHTFGYPSNLSRESILSVHDFARSLLAAIHDCPSMNQGDKASLIFVAHSMGGLVVKKAFILAHQEAEFQPLIQRISSIIFLATPHQGAAIAQTLALLMTFVLGRSESKAHKEAMVLEDQAALSKFLGVLDLPEDDVTKQDCVRFPGSCEWLSSNVFYAAWRNSVGSKLLWLRGRPGTGKSVLAGHIVNDLRAAGQDCCSFFFQSGDSNKSTVNGCLRSIAWQMALLHREVFERIKCVMAELRGDPIDKIDANPVWRELYSSGILDVGMEKPQFWIIDAMDECKQSTDMMNFLAQIQEKWPVSVLVTCRDPAETHLGHANSRIEIQSYDITVDDNKQDICLFLTSNLSHLPPLAFAHWPSPSAMMSHLVDTSRGSFLWASLVCSGLRQVTSEREVTDVLETVPPDMDALYCNILDEMGRAKFGKALAKALLTWTTYAFRPLTTAEIQQPVEIDIDDKFKNVEQAVSRTCGNMLCVDSQGKIQLVHLTAREFLIGRSNRPDLIAGKSESHRRLALVCLRYLIRMEDSSSKSKGRHSRDRTGRLGSSSTVISGQGSPALSSASDISHNIRPPTSGLSEPHAFTTYASMFCFSHLNMVLALDDEIVAVLSKFLGSSSVLRWIEFIATSGDLRAVYQAGQTIKLMLRRWAGHSKSTDLASGQDQLSTLEKWGNDLVQLVTKFSYWLLLSPKSIFHLIPPFCPVDSAVRQQFVDPCRGLSLHGLSSRGWNDCLKTITYAKDLMPRAIATGAGFFAIGMSNRGGNIMVYDDSVFQELHAVLHGEPVSRLAFTENGDFFASAGSSTVRIWSSAAGTEMMNFAIPSRCIALSFADEDCTLRVATQQNELVEWDLEERSFFYDAPSTWTSNLPERMQGRVPTTAAFSPRKNLLCVIYRGERLVLWDYVENRIYDIYEKDTGSIFHYGMYYPTSGSTTVRGVSLSHGPDTNRIAAIHSDGDLIVYNLDNGQQMATVQRANTLTLASSKDGRTLAGADSSGNLTLFEFDTLCPLYRIRFDNRASPECLAFTSDSHRLIEVRGNQCRVWSPAGLLRTGSSKEENADDISPPDKPPEVYHQCTPGVRITAIATCIASSAVFCGMEDGSVHAYDLPGEPKSQPLYVQRRGVPISMLYLDEYSANLGFLASSDQSWRVAVRKVTRKKVPGQTVWETGDEPLIYTNSQCPENLRQIVVSGKQSRLLLCTENSDMLWSMPEQGEEELITKIDRDDRTRWLSHPTQPDLIVRATASGISLHRWSDLSSVRALNISLEGAFDQLISLLHRQYFATISTEAPTTWKNIGKNKPSHICIWDFDQLDSDTELITPVKQLSCASSHTELVAGTYRDRMVVFTTDCWIGSVDLAPSSEDSFVRHFFVPSDWVSDGHGTIIGVGRGAEIVFARRSELAVIKRGLEVTETGAGFNLR